MIDALRGFAVLAILLVHNLEHFIFPVYPTDFPEWLDLLDQGVHHTIFALFADKAYAIFALLFGLTFHIQSSNMACRGCDFGHRFLWRMVMLVGFATVNAAFFPAGDVLLLFAVVSLILFFTRNRLGNLPAVANGFLPMVALQAPSRPSGDRLAQMDVDKQ